VRRSITQPCSASGDLGLASREKQLQEIRFALERPNETLKMTPGSKLAICPIIKA